MLDRSRITGLVLAGGRATRMGGTDKGLLLFDGRPLALHAALRLAPQVAAVAVSANRNAAAYAALDLAVWPDLEPGYPGPLAGFAAGLARCPTSHLATVACDTPNFPADLVMRLAEAMTDGDPDIAMATTRSDGRQRAEPVFCLMKATLRDSLLRFMSAGGRKVRDWALSKHVRDVRFDDAAAFANVNTPGELEALQPRDTGRR